MPSASSRRRSRTRPCAAGIPMASGASRECPARSSRATLATRDTSGASARRPMIPNEPLRSLAPSSPTTPSRMSPSGAKCSAARRASIAASSLCGNFTRHPIRRGLRTRTTAAVRPSASRRWGSSIARPASTIS